MLVAIFILLFILVCLQILLNGNIYQVSKYLKYKLDNETVVRPSSNTRPSSSGSGRRTTKKIANDETKENGVE